MEKLEPDRPGNKRNFAFNWKKRCAWPTRGRDFVFPPSLFIPGPFPFVTIVIVSSPESLRSDFPTRGRRTSNRCVTLEKFRSIRRDIRSCSLSTGDDAQDRLSPIFIRATLPWTASHRADISATSTPQPVPDDRKTIRIRRPVESRPSPRLREAVVESRVELYDFTDIRALGTNTVHHPASHLGRGPSRESRTAIRSRCLFVGSRTWTDAVASRAGRNQGKICDRTRRASHAGKSRS